MSKSAKKNAKRKEKRDTQKAEVLEAKIKENWEDDDDDDDEVEEAKDASSTTKPSAKTQEGQAAKPKEDVDASATDTLVEKLERLDVR